MTFRPTQMKKNFIESLAWKKKISSAVQANYFFVACLSVICPWPAKLCPWTRDIKRYYYGSQAKSGQRKSFIFTDPAGQVNWGSAAWLTWESSMAIRPVITAGKWFPGKNIEKETDFARQHYTSVQESRRGEQEACIFMWVRSWKHFPFVSATSSFHTKNHPKLNGWCHKH